MNRLSNVFSIFFLVAPLFLQAQDRSSLPKVYPSFSEDFSTYNSFPSHCIQETFQDNQGRLWLIPCTPTRINTSKQLLQFDGYNFRYQEGDIERLPPYAIPLKVEGGKRLIGIIPKLDSNLLYTYNLETQHLQIISQPIKGKVQSLETTKRGRIFLLIKQNRQFLFNELKQEKLIELARFKYPELLASSSFIISATDNEVWFKTSDKKAYLLRFKLQTKEIRKYFFSEFQKKFNRDTAFGNLSTAHYNSLDDVFFIGWSNQQKKRLYKYDAQEDQIKLVYNTPDFVGKTHSAFEDDLGNRLFLFLGTNNQYQATLRDFEGNQFDYTAFFKGFGRRPIHSIQSKDFRDHLTICWNGGLIMHKVTNTKGIQHFLKGVSIRAMVELPKRQFLISTSGQGLHLLDLNTKTVSKAGSSICNNNYEYFRRAFYRDSQAYILDHSKNAIIRYHPATQTCESYETSLSYIRNFVPIGQDSLVLITPDYHLHLFQFSTGRHFPMTYQGKLLSIEGNTNGIFYDQKDAIWLPSNNGLWKVNIRTFKMEVLGHEPPFLDHRFLSMVIDSSGKLWLGTSLAGLHIYDPKTGKIEILNSELGLANNAVANILEDDEGDWWIGTYNGISVVDKDAKLIANFGLKDGLIEKENNRFATLKAQDGSLLIGTIKGLNIIDPSIFKNRIQAKEPLKVYLTFLEYFDQASGTKKTQRLNLDGIQSLRLPASQRFLNLRFAVSNYFQAKENQFTYKLEGIDDDWISLGNQNSLILNNLPPGKYRLLIRGGDAYGNWSEEPIAISIHAREIFYKKVWFYLLLLSLLGFGAIVWIRRLRTEVQKATQTIQDDKAVIEAQAKQLKELDQAKTRFFTNISHEFRTPLTLISGIAARLINNPNAREKHQFKMILRNSKQLLSLVNQILDLRKLESSKIEANMIQADIVPYIQYLFESLEALAQSRGVHAHLLIEEQQLIMDFDKEKILRVLANLFANAIKFTPAEGNIYWIARINKFQEHPVSTETRKDSLLLQIKDTGQGIPAQKLPYIFDRFYQVGDDTIEEKGGTGIGLALCKELVELMEGRITVESQFGKGSIFSVSLPITNKAPKLGLEEIEVPPTEELDLPGLNPSQTSVPVLIAGNNSRALVLIIEDNPDVSLYLKSCLENKYQLLFAKDGQEGIEKALKHVPDAIISDVMMPQKDGFEVCHTLKTDERSSHIPILLLTAKADPESRLSGLRKGADDYLIKPFYEEELLTRLENQLKIRRKLQVYFQSKSSHEEELPKEVQPEDEFLKKVRVQIETHISDEDFGVVHLCRALNLSRTQLYRKVKALTGNGTAQYMRKIRLLKAKELLETTDLNVSQVAYEVGFRFPNNFSKAYSEEFGIRPSETRK